MQINSMFWIELSLFRFLFLGEDLEKMREEKIRRKVQQELMMQRAKEKYLQEFRERGLTEEQVKQQ